MYIAELCTLLCGYPLWAGEKAVEKVKDISEWPATRAVLKPLLEDQVKVHRYAAEWERAAQAQISRSTAPLLEGPPPPPRPTYDELKAKYGPNWGLGTAEADGAARARHIEQVERANRKVIESAHAASGTPRTHPLSASPILAARIAEQDATRAAIPPEPPQTRRARDVGKPIGSVARSVVSSLSAELDDEIPF